VIEQGCVRWLGGNVVELCGCVNTRRHVQCLLNIQTVVVVESVRSVYKEDHKPHS